MIRYRDVAPFSWKKWKEMGRLAGTCTPLLSVHCPVYILRGDIRLDPCRKFPSNANLPKPVPPSCLPFSSRTLNAGVSGLSFQDRVLESHAYAEHVPYDQRDWNPFLFSSLLFLFTFPFITFYCFHLLLLVVCHEHARATMPTSQKPDICSPL